MSDADRMAHGTSDSTETSRIVRSSEIAGGNFQEGGGDIARDVVL
jgi:hypothetical protein